MPNCDKHFCQQASPESLPSLQRGQATATLAATFDVHEDSVYGEQSPKSQASWEVLSRSLFFLPWCEVCSTVDPWLAAIVHAGLKDSFVGIGRQSRIAWQSPYESPHRPTSQGDCPAFLFRSVCRCQQRDLPAQHKPPQFVFMLVMLLPP